MTRFVLCLGLLVAFGFGERIQISEFGTTAVAVWTPTMVVMAADGLVTRRNDPSTSHYPTCKTRVVGEYAVTAAGFYARRSVGFDVWRELERILKQANSLSAAASMVHSVVEPALKRAVDDVRVRNPESLQRDMSADYLAIAVAGRDQAKPALWTIDYLPERGNRIGVETKTYPLRGVVVAPDHLGLSIIGERGAIDRDYPDTRLIPALRAEPAKTARTLSS